MKKVRCVKGHFYDSDASTLCPHCGSQEAKAEMTAAVEDSKVSEVGKKRFFAKGKAEKEIKSSIVADSDFSGSSSVSKESVQSVRKSVSNSNGEAQKTRSFWSFEEDVADAEEEIQEDATDYKAPTSESRPHRDIDSVKTTSIYTQKDGGEPVTGWLVCIEGAHYGQSFEIKSGQSAIGRDSSMDICMKKEGSISREKHAYIIFEPKKRQFLLRSGDGKGLTYCNEELVTGIVSLNAYDNVQLGDAKYLFVPFCNEKFMWEKAEK